MIDAKNVLGGKLDVCGTNPRTGFYRTGCCETGPDDQGVHVVCAIVTKEFLDFTEAQGNDLTTPRPGFPGLTSGDCWCLCAERWQEALDAGVAPGVVLEATHEAALRYVRLDDLRTHAVSRSNTQSDQTKTAPSSLNGHNGFHR